MKKQFEVWFDGRVTVEFDTEEYEHYDNEGRGGWEQLAIDLVRDEAALFGRPFVDGSFQIVRPGAAELQ